MKTLLLIIDMQKDFCCPSGNLYVPGAAKDVEKVSALIARRGKEIEGIIVTQDVHQVMDIAHPPFWKDREGKSPVPFTKITLKEVENGDWRPFAGKEKVITYLRELEAKGKQHNIWQEHCIEGSEGAALHPTLMQEIRNWASLGHCYNVVEKGKYPLSEQYGIFRTEIPDPQIPSTWFNIPLLRELNRYEEIGIVGEAKSHCVASSVEQLLAFPALVSRLVLLEDCMSDIPGCEASGDEVYAAAQQLGAQRIISTEWS